MGKDPDAQGSGSEKKDLFWSRQKSVKHRQGSESRKVKLRGDPKTELARVFGSRVEAGKSEIRLTCKKKKN